MKGWPDYTRVTGLVENYDEYAQNYPVGIGDGTARLGSIKTYDMRGRVWQLEDFEAAVLHWHTLNVGIGGAQGLITDYVRNGNQALGLTSNTGAFRQSTAWRYFQMPRNQNMGAELSFSQEVDFRELQILVQVDDGTNYSYANVAILEGPPAMIQYQTAAGWIDTGLNVVLSNDLTLFHTLKIAFDYDLDEWIRILYDDQEIDLQHTAMQHPAGGVAPRTHVILSNVGDNVNNSRICIDDLILTIMEPE